jgi:trehalose synthase
MSLKATSDLWWKNGVVYCVDVETFLDDNGDGVGDFAGLTNAVDYLAGLGVTCIWLMPFYPSPDRDDGYDVTDFYNVDPRLGTLGDFVEFVRTARDRGIDVIADLVVNHTSTAHPWFQAARSDAGSPFHDYYIWSQERPAEPGPLVFPGAEESSWEWDEAAGKYYLHRFYRHQADLNVSNPQVRDEIHKVIGFWLQLGLSGFRVDAVPFLLSEPKITGELNSDPHLLLRNLRGFLTRRQGNAILLGEVNLPPKEQVAYFGEEHGDELHMVFNFTLNQALYLALAREDATPVTQVLADLPAAAEQNQWANFVRNHDELTLDQLSDDERGEVFAAFGPREDMQLFGRGLRRRLPSMLDGDRRRVELVYSLLFALPGTPVLLYGEEIGMAENLDIDGRMSVRTPMQWSGEPNGGFAPEHAEQLAMPLVTGEFGPEHVNIADQRRDPESLLNWMERMIRRRKECPELGWGRGRVLDTGDAAVLAHRCDWEQRHLLAVHNLASTPRSVRLRLDDAADLDGMIDLVGGRDFQRLDGDTVDVDLDGYGYRWLRLQRRGARLRA